MHYVISDIHGCYKEYLEALEKINFSDEDVLYVLGDCVDRGPDSIKLLQDMMERDNVVPIVGNHELMALSVLKKLCIEITEDNAETHLSLADMQKFLDWSSNGGDKTIKEFRKLSKEEQQDILDYLGDFEISAEADIAGKNYVLVHAGLEPFDEYKDIEDYDISEIVFTRANYDHMYFEDRYTITGHTPTVMQDGNEGTIIHKNNHIAIDCGCVFGYNLAVFCLETGEEFYIHSECCYA